MEGYQYFNSRSGQTSELLYRVNRAGSGEVGPDFIIERKSSYPYSVIHYIEKGRGEISCRGKKHSVSKGQCFILNCFEGHTYRTDPNDTLALNWIEFSGGDSAKLIGAFLNAHLPVIDGEHSLIINKYIMKVIAYLQSTDKDSEIFISRIIYNIAMHLLLECEREAFKTLSGPQTQYIENILNYIDSNLNAGLSVEMLARVFNYNPQYFTRLFQKHMSVTPAKYIMSKRIGRAVELLGKEDIQIDILAEQLGFCNSSHFIREFKKAEGLTPAEFRKETLSYSKR